MSSMSPDPGPLLKPADVARKLNVSARTVQRWAALGKLEAVSLPGGQLRFEPEMVRRLTTRPR